MNRIFAALILSTAAIGAAQAGETGYLDNPGANAQSVQSTQAPLSRAQVQQALNADRANVDAFQGQLNPARTEVRVGNDTRAQAARQDQFAKAANPAGAAFVNG